MLPHSLIKHYFFIIISVCNNYDDYYREFELNMFGSSESSVSVAINPKESLLKQLE